MSTLKEKLLLKISPKTLIEKSEYFDADWYSRTYDVKGDAAAHYLKEGWLKDFDPSLRFSSKDYLINNPDLHDINPLLHYEAYGKYEGRRPFVPRRRQSNHYEVSGVQIDLKEYEKALGDAKVVSFDVFDTLLIRPFLKEKEVFAYLEAVYAVPGFADNRIKAEEEARKKLNMEVNIDEIYEQIDKRYASLKEKEIEAEIRFNHRNPLIYKVYELALKHKKRVIAVSDMYLPERVIRLMLEKAGYSLSEVYVSCERRKTKAQGDLFSFVLDAEKIRTKDLLHFGDNYVSDYSRPMEMGISAFETPKLKDVLFSKEPFALNYYHLHEDLASSIYLSQIAEFLCGKKDLPFFTRLAYLFGGPLAFSYLTFVDRKAKEEGIDQLLFVSRDGYCLKELYEKYFEDGLDFAYAYLSRAAIASGGLTNHLCEDVSKILSLAAKYPGDFAVSDSDEENKRESEKKKEELSAWSKRQSEFLETHLLKLLGDHKNAAGVDMFSGNYTSQKGAMYYLKEKLKMGFYAGNFASCDLKHESFCKRLLGMRDNLAVKMSEFLITSFESGIIGVDENGEPVYESGPDERRKARYEQIQRGMEMYAEDFLAYFERDGRLLLDVEAWLDLSDSYFRYCEKEEMEKLSEVVDSEGLISLKHDPRFDELIALYRQKGY